MGFRFCSDSNSLIMDTISRENNSMLPIGGIIVGVIALALGLYATVSLSHLKNQVTGMEAQVAKIDDVASQASAASAKADAVKASLDSVAKQTQDGFNSVGNAIGTMQAQLVKIEESSKHPSPVAGKGGAHEAAVAGPGEYVVKSGDSLAKIARANGCSLADLQAVNPGVESKHLKIGQKLKLPEKKP